MDELDRCIQEQAECRAYLDGPEREPNWHQMTAWIMEETILMLDGVGDSCADDRTEVGGNV